MKRYDRIILGAGMYGLYAAIQSAKMGCSVLIVEHDSAPFMRATYINQARVHQGYHYPRSLYTASKTATYFRRFNDDFGFCINRSFDQIYATSARMSWSDAQQFSTFCEAANIPCEEVNPLKYFKQGVCDGAFRTQEYTYDAKLLKQHLLEDIDHIGEVSIKFNSWPVQIEQWGGAIRITLSEGELLETNFLLNATYASVNQILEIASIDKLGIKYELCEIALCKPNGLLRECGLTVMDGPFFSIMPFGMTGHHSLTSVSFTPHSTSHNELPVFECQKEVDGYCIPGNLGNCNECRAKPMSAYPYMANLAKKYLKDDYQFHHVTSLYSMKPILKSSEIDDSRPTVIKIHSESPTFVSVLSGKISTIYDMDEVLTRE